MNAPHDSAGSTEAAPEPHPRGGWLWRLLVGMAISAVSAMTVWGLLQTFQIYKTTNIIGYALTQPKVLWDPAERHPQETVLFERGRQNQKHLLTSDLVLRKALVRPGISDAIDQQHAAEHMPWLKSHLDVSTPENSEIILVSLWGSRPEGLGAVLNAVQEAYFDEIVSVDMDARARRLDELNRIRQQKEEEIRGQRNTLKKIGEVVGDAPSGSYELDNKRKEISRLNDIVDRIATEIEMHQIELSAPPRIKLYDTASPPQPLYGNWRLPIAIAVGVAFLLLTQIVLARWR